MNDLLTRQLQRLAWQRRIQRGIDAALPPMAACLAVAATAVMAVRLALPGLAWVAPAVAVAGVLAPLAWLPRGMRHREAAHQLAGHLDVLLDARGLAMGLAEARDEGWMERLRRPLEQFSPPALRWPGLLAGLAAGALLLVALWLPQAQPRRERSTPIDRLFAPAAEQLATLSGLGALPEAEAEALAKRLDILRGEARNHGMDQTTWEALARVESALAEQHGLSARRLAEALVQADVAGRSAPAQAAEAAAALAQQLGELARQAPGLLPQLPTGATADALAKALAEAEAKGLLTAEQREALERKGLRQAKAGGEPLSAADVKALADAVRAELERRAQGFGSTELDALLAELGQGEGPPERGPGHGSHPKVGQDETPIGALDGLPPGARLNPDGSITLAESVREPEAEADALSGPARAAVQAFDPAAADARRAVTAPRHRAAVGRYFSADASVAVPRPSSPEPIP